MELPRITIICTASESNDDNDNDNNGDDDNNDGDDADSADRDYDVMMMIKAIPIITHCKMILQRSTMTMWCKFVLLYRHLGCHLARHLPVGRVISCITASFFDS